VLLHLALLGAIGSGVGDVGGERPLAAVPWIRIRMVAVEAPSVPARAERPVEEQTAPAPQGTPALSRSAPTAAMQKPGPRSALAGPTATITSGEIASARSLTVPATSGEVETPPPSTVDPTAPDAVVSLANEPATIATEPHDALDLAVEATPDPAWVKVALDTARAAPGFLGPGERPPPTYRTILPAPAVLQYELRRGILRGTGEIRWRPAGDRYALQFEARLAGFTLIAQSSQGEIAPNGLAPVRFVEQRARKAPRSVNFSRDSATITFSASTARWPLLEGTQDRLSWMIQLGGIVAADPSLATTGRISMILVSARGEASVRTARFAGRERAETAVGSVSALKFVVDGHSAYDGSFEIWLDPARGYLPARAVSRASSGDAEFELLLQRADP